MASTRYQRPVTRSIVRSAPPVKQENVTGVKHAPRSEDVSQSYENAIGESTQDLIYDYIAARDIVFPKDACKDLALDRKTFNSLVTKLVTTGKVTRIEDDNKTNPRYKIRNVGEAAVRKQTEDDPGNRPKVKPEEALEVLKDMGAARARDLARDILGKDTFSAIKALNSALHGLTLDGKVEKYSVEDDEPHYRVIE